MPVEWSGEATITTTVERWIRHSTGEYFEDSDPQVPVEEDSDWELLKITLTVKGNGYYDSGRLYGPPEHCYPPEGELEIESILGPDGTDWSETVVPKETSHFKELLEEAIREKSGESFL